MTTSWNEFHVTVASSATASQLSQAFRNNNAAIKRRHSDLHGAPASHTQHLTQQRE